MPSLLTAATPPATPSRRSVLRWFLSTGLGLGLAACGSDGEDDEPTADPTAQLQAQADAAVAAGLVGLVLGEQSSSANRVVVAGRRRLGQTAPVQAADRFAIGSNTKAMTCAAVVAAADRGGPALNLTLPEAFPDWAGEIPPAYAGVTLTDLLHHRGGLPAFNGSGPEEEAFIAAVSADPGPLPDTMAGRRAYFARWLLAQAPADGLTPGSGFHYSNAGYVLAAAMVEAHSGRSFESLFDETVVQPLGLDGHWRSPVPGAGDSLWGHEGAQGALAVWEGSADDANTPNIQVWQDALGPAGHWACSGAAYARWLDWHLRALRGEATALPARYVSDLRAASGDRYVWGWQTLVTPNRTLLSHTGHEPGFMAEAVFDRSGDFAVFGLSNTGHMAEDGSSWVLGRIDATLAEVLKLRNIAL